MRNADRLKRETNAAISQAAKDKLKRLEKDAAKTYEAEKKLVHDLLCLRREILIKTVEQYDAFRVSVSDADEKVVKEMKKQIRILHKVCDTPLTYTLTFTHSHTSASLIKVYGHPRKDLMTFTCMKKPVPTPLLRLQYRVILTKIESGMLKVPVRTVLDTVLKSRHVFRGGTAIDDDMQAMRKKYYKDMIAKCKAERAAKKAIAKRKSGTVPVPLPSHSHQI